MKKLIFFLIILYSFNISCIREYETLTRFTIHNGSNYDVTLSVFDFQIPDKSIVDTTFIILKNTGINYYYRLDGRNAVYDFPFGIEADSTYLTFNNSKRITYRQGDLKPRNIIHTYSFTGGRKNDELYEYEYSITNADFNIAEK